MHDILILTSRNVVTSGGEFSLIKNRALALQAYWGLESDIIALCNINLGVPEGAEAFGKGTYIRRNFSNPFSLLSGYKTLAGKAEEALRNSAYKAVLLSGVGMLRYVDQIRRCAPPQTLVCADVHGYYGDGRLLAKDESFAMGAFHTLAAMVEEREQRSYLKRFDRIFTVSNAYERFLCDTANCKREQFYVVPCATGNIPSFTEAQEKEFRRQYRKKYGIANDEALLVYSGGTSSWQCLSQTVDLYQKIQKKTPTKLLILSGDESGARAKTGGAEGVLVDSYQPSELPFVFCAADYFVMLREDVPTNHFAFPNKFLEYAAAHKPIIATPFVYDVATQIAQSGIGILYEGDVNKLVKDMHSFSCPPASFNQIIEQNSFKTTLAPFAKDLNERASKNANK